MKVKQFWMVVMNVLHNRHRYSMPHSRGVYVRGNKHKKRNMHALSPKDRTPSSHPRFDRCRLSEVRSCHIELIIDCWCYWGMYVADVQISTGARRYRERYCPLCVWRLPIPRCSVPAVMGFMVFWSKSRSSVRGEPMKRPASNSSLRPWER